MGVDEAMVLCKKFKALSDAFPDDWGLSDEDDDDEEEEEDITNEESCSEDRSDYTGSSRTSTGKEWEVEEIYNVRVGDEADRKAKGAFRIPLLGSPLYTLYCSLTKANLTCYCILSSPGRCVAVRLKRNLTSCRLFLSCVFWSGFQPSCQLAADLSLTSCCCHSTSVALGTDADGVHMWAVLVGKDAGELLQPLTEDNSWLEFQVKWKGWSSKSCPDGTTWVPQGDLCCDRLLARFVQDLRRRRIVPLPGQPSAC